MRTALNRYNDCPNQHFSKLDSLGNPYSGINCCSEYKGHPLVCFSDDSNCHSTLRVLRAGATHFPVLRKFLGHLYKALNSHNIIHDIDKSLCLGDYKSLMKITQVRDFDCLLSNALDSAYEQCSDAACSDSFSKNPSLEAQLLLKHARVITALEKEMQADPEHACCSCEQWLQRKAVRKVELSDDLVIQCG